MTEAVPQQACSSEGQQPLDPVPDSSPRLDDTECTLSGPPASPSDCSYRHQTEADTSEKRSFMTNLVNYNAIEHIAREGKGSAVPMAVFGLEHLMEGKLSVCVSFDDIGPSLMIWSFN